MCLGRIDNSHLALADLCSTELAANNECLHLAELHSKAVDYAKSGVLPDIKDAQFAPMMPDYMQKPKKQTVESQTVLGVLFRLVKLEIRKRDLGSVFKGITKHANRQMRKNQPTDKY